MERLPQFKAERAPATVIRVVDWRHATLWSQSRSVATLADARMLDRVVERDNLVTYRYRGYGQDSPVLNAAFREDMMVRLGGLEALGRECKQSKLRMGKGLQERVFDWVMGLNHGCSGMYDRGRRTLLNLALRENFGN